MIGRVFTTTIKPGMISYLYSSQCQTPVSGLGKLQDSLLAQLEQRPRRADGSCSFLSVTILRDGAEVISNSSQKTTGSFFEYMQPSECMQVVQSP